MGDKLIRVWSSRTETPSGIKRAVRYNWLTISEDRQIQTHGAIRVKESDRPGDTPFMVEYTITRGDFSALFFGQGSTRREAFDKVRKDVMGQFRLATFAMNSLRHQPEPSDTDWKLPRKEVE